jgi:hypothetical protein
MRDMNIITLLLSIVALILSVGASAIAVKCRMRLDALEISTPDAGTRGAGGSGRR